MKTITFLSLLFVVINVYAQDSTLKSGIIYRLWPGYKMDGHKLKEKELQAQLYKTPAAIPYYKKAQTRELIGLSFIPPAVLFAVLSRKNSNNINDPSYEKTKTGFVVAAMTSAGVSIFFLLHSLKNKNKAVHIHNEKFRSVY